MRATGIKDLNGNMIKEGDIVKRPSDDYCSKVVWIGDSDEMDWVAENFNGSTDSWLDSSFEIVRNT